MPFLRRYDVPVIVNIWGKTIEEYAEVAARLDAVPGIAGLEVNVSCPNIKEGSQLFGTNLALFEKVVKAIRAATRLPMIPKLAPNVSDIAEYARCAEACGADAISLINSVPALAVDIETRRAKLANITGGLTGPAIKPIALRLVWQAARAVKIPVVGMGGITCAEDALEFLHRGRPRGGGGHRQFHGPGTALRVVRGISDYLRRHNLASLDPLVGSFQA
jgi:dihydroorotate dehydrogenase (NAD+) catalytic subunit